MFDRILRAGKQLLAPAATAALASPYTGVPARPRVLQIVHNPPVETEGGRRLTELFGWNDPDRLARQYIADLAASSYGYLQYQIVEQITADWFPPKLDGFRYTGPGYVQA